MIFFFGILCCLLKPLWFNMFSQLIEMLYSKSIEITADFLEFLINNWGSIRLLNRFLLLRILKYLLSITSRLLFFTLCHYVVIDIFDRGKSVKASISPKLMTVRHLISNESEDLLLINVVFNLILLLLWLLNLSLSDNWMTARINTLSLFELFQPFAIILAR